jgi:hypothetical protein
LGAYFRDWPTFPVAAKRRVHPAPNADLAFPSGGLEVGDYAQEADGSYISNIPAYTYTDATSSVLIAAAYRDFENRPNPATLPITSPANNSTTTPQQESGRLTVASDGSWILTAVELT